MSRVIDCHCHIYPDAICQRAVQGISGFYGLPLVYDGSIGTLRALGKAHGIDHFVVFSVATTPHQTQSINSFIARSVQESRGAMTGLGTVHPESADIRSEVEAIRRLGLKGVKLHHDIQKIEADDIRCMRIYEQCEEKGLPVLLHAGDNRYDYSNPKRLEQVLKRFPHLTVIGAHLGGWSVWEEAADRLPPYANFHVDCSSSLYALTPERARSIIRAYGAERVLFGTDYPMWPVGAELSRLRALGLSEQEMEAITHRNAQKLLGIAPAGAEAAGQAASS